MAHSRLRFCNSKNEVFATAFDDSFLGAGSLYASELPREVEESINFVTCHDGFTLNNLVSYNYKHNEENGEGNRDGRDDFLSWNCGFEGPTDDPEIEALRNRQVKNLFTAVILAAGVPMFVMGDEVRRSQRGNNNAYCQDNDTSWLDWNLLSKHANLLRFVKLLIERRMLRDVEHERHRVSLSLALRDQKLAWHGVKLALRSDSLSVYERLCSLHLAADSHLYE